MNKLLLSFFSCLVFVGNAVADYEEFSVDAFLNKDGTVTATNYCDGGRFLPCVCWDNVPTTVKYNPSDARCGKSTFKGDTANSKASITLSGNLANSYSVVVRDRENADRSPYESRLCSKKQYAAGLNRCSRWKVQKAVKSSGKTLHCLGASGHSKVFSGISRITVKVSNAVRSDGTKDIRRYCLKDPTLPLN